MSRFTTWRRTFAVAAILLLAGAGAAVAQEQSGNLYGTVTDTQGDALPGVRVEVTGIGAPQTTFTNAQGQFRFLSMSPGNYSLTSSLEGFSTVEYPNVNVRVGRSTTLEITLSPAVEEVITVTSESPLLDERKVAQGVSISQIELEKIPTARDPWAIVTQTPGVLSDRINVGGNESGQQAVFLAPGVSDDENTFAVDGVIITDMAAIGASPTYYDFDQFEEIQVSTGGSDIEKVSAGAALNLVTKRGSNNPRGSARYMLTDADEQFGIFEQATPDTASDAENGDGNGGRLGSPQTRLPGTQINEILDFGFEAGGPILRDKLWIWGSYGRNDIKQLSATTGNPDNTLLENSAIKFNGQPISANSAVASWNRGDKLKDGRLGVPNRALSASWNQDGPTEIWKIEDTHVFSSDFYLTGLYSYVDGGFQLQSKAGKFPSPETTSTATAIAQGETLLNPSNIWVNGWYSGLSDRNTDNYQVDGSYFFNTGNLNHELKFGSSYRFFESASNFGWPGGRNLANITCEAVGLCGVLTSFGFVGDDLVVAQRSDGFPFIEQTYTAAWIQDTLTSGNWTVNAGIRYDLQEGTNVAATVRANPVFPAVLPALNYAGEDAPFEWESISPRVGVTYALGAERKTLLRGSFARFAEQLQTGDIGRLNPVSAAYATFAYADVNGNNYYDVGEPVDLADPLFFLGFDPSNPTSLVSPNVTDPGLDPPMTNEYLLGVEHAFLPEFVMGIDLTVRNTSDILEGQTFVRGPDGVKRVQTSADFTPSLVTNGEATPNGVLCSNGTNRPHLPDGTPWCTQYFRFVPGVGPAGGSFLTNGDREVDYQGVAVNFTKRLSNRWMARGYVNYGEAEWDVPASFLNHDDPTPSALGGDVDGRLFVVQSAGSGPFTDVLIQSTWSANLNGMYQVMPDRPWGFNVAGNLFGREGYPLPYDFTATTADGRNRQAAVTAELDEIRTDDIWVLDLRLEKDMRFSDNLSGILSIDAFNVTNDNSVLQRDRTLNVATANYVTQTLSPRIYRLGFRLNWR